MNTAQTPFAFFTVTYLTRIGNQVATPSTTKTGRSDEHKKETSRDDWEFAFAR